MNGILCTYCADFYNQRALFILKCILMTEQKPDSRPVSVCVCVYIYIYIRVVNI